MNFQLDIRTLVYLFIFGNLFILLLITNYRSNASKDIASIRFIRSKWLQLLFWCSLLLWDFVPHYLSIPISNLLMLSGCYLEMTALLMMMGQMGRRVKLYYLVLIVCGVISYSIIALFYNFSSLRIACASIGSTLFVLYPAYYLTANGKGSPLQRILGLLLYVFAAIMLGRALVALIWSPEMNVFTTNLSQNLYYIGMYLLLIVGTAGFILLANEHTYVKLKRIATYDELTGTLNRRAFFQDAEVKFAEAVRKQEYISFLLLDLDHFKKVNDTYGHDIGDLVLQDFALTIKGYLANGDLFGRLGGEEFAILLYGMDEKSCDHKAEVLREAIMKSSNPEIPQGYTVSIGLITIFPDSQASLNMLYRLSDKALYQAKQEGRNRVIRYPYVY